MQRLESRVNRMTKLTRAEATEQLGSAGLSGTLAVLLAAATWAFSGIAVAFIVSEADISAPSLAFWRDITSFAVVGIALALLRPAWLRVRRADLRWLVALGATLGTLHVFWTLGVILNGAAVATVQLAVMPAIVAVVAWLTWGESLGWSKILAIILAFVGTVLVSGLDVLGQTKMSLGGFLIGLGIPSAYAAWSLIGKKVREQYNSFTALTYAFGFAALMLLPFQFFTPQPRPVTPSATLWFGVLVIVSTLIPFIAYTFALGRLPASVASILAMSEIAFVAVFAYLLLDERLTASQILGAVLVVGGMLLLYWQRWKVREDR
jgi:DME family drug/metabolite transporter